MDVLRKGYLLRDNFNPFHDIKRPDSQKLPSYLRATCPLCTLSYAMANWGLWNWLDLKSSSTHVNLKLFVWFYYIHQFFTAQLPHWSYDLGKDWSQDDCSKFHFSVGKEWFQWNLTSALAPLIWQNVRRMRRRRREGGHPSLAACLVAPGNSRAQLELWDSGCLSVSRLEMETSPLDALISTRTQKSHFVPSHFNHWTQFLPQMQSNLF